MKKDILYKLSKEGLYPSYVELKASGISEEIFLKQKIGLYILIMI